jgi:hypothetical protein
MAEKALNYFERLNNINVSGKTEKKGNLTYLSWVFAWGEVKKLHPDATYTIYERDTQWGPVNYFTDGRTCWVKTGVTINGIEHIEELYVMDYGNKSITLDKITSQDVNKAIQRSITKAIARHGLGLYVYEGEDLPEVERAAKLDEVVEENKAKQKEEFAKIDAKSDAVKKDKPAAVIQTDKLPWG